MDESVSEVSLDDVLDLHHFHPKDVEVILDEFLRVASESGRRTVKIIHGKGLSRVKARVARFLEASDLVLEFRDDGGNWGATMVKLK
jgi:DNA-nicking Smr family endonuclease